MPAPDDDLTVLFPLPKTMDIAGEKVEMPVATIRAATMFRQRWVAMTALAEANETEAMLIERCPDAANALLAIPFPDRADWIASLSALDKFELVLFWLETNKDFFDRLRLLNTRGAGITRALMPELFGDGSMPSNTSSNAGTQTPADTRPQQPTVTRLRHKEPKSGSGGSD